MEYVRLTGEGGVFGWQSAQDGVWRLTLGGCTAGECLVIGEAGTRRITPDAGGAFRGDTAFGRALCVAALPEGALLAYDYHGRRRASCAGSAHAPLCLCGRSKRKQRPILCCQSLCK